MIQRVEIVETLSRVVYIDSPDNLSAENEVRKYWLDAKIVLDGKDFKSVEFKAIDKDGDQNG